MGARVINPVMLAEFTKIRSPAVRSHLPSANAIAKIKKDLFGPVDKEDSKRFINTELAKHQVAASKRWNFDFVRGRPLISKSSNYIWERVPPTTSVPEVYTLSRAAHAAAAASSVLCASSSSLLVPSYNDLLDERSARSNKHSTLIEMDVSVTSSIIGEDTGNQSGCDQHFSSLIEQMQPECTITSKGSSIREKRQPKITDYLKERKRLTPTPKKVSPSKRTRATISLMLRQ